MNSRFGKHYNINYQDGKNHEEVIKPVLCSVFQDTLVSSKYRYTHWDFVGRIFFYEVKSCKNYRMYPYVLLGTNKAICNNIMFIFVFNDVNMKYYIRYDRVKFDNFKTMWVKPTGRLYKNECWLIPYDDLIEFKNTDKIEIEIYENEDDLRNSLIQNDITGSTDNFR